MRSRVEGWKRRTRQLLGDEKQKDAAAAAAAPSDPTLAGVGKKGYLLFKEVSESAKRDV
jgi:hypothetical protein